jgi:polyhydroxyalkanoate synthesis regulator phasin
MIDLFKKGIFLGIGLFEEGREKVEAVVDELIKKGELAKEERTKAIENFIHKIQQQEKAISEKINIEIKKAIDKLGIPSKSEFDKLVKEVETLKKKVGKSQTKSG